MSSTPQNNLIPNPQIVHTNNSSLSSSNIIIKICLGIAIFLCIVSMSIAFYYFNKCKSIIL
jgi:hypothetical protein